MHQGERPKALAGRSEDGVEHSGRGHEDRGLTHTAPESTRRHDDRLDLRHLVDAHRGVAVEVRLFDATVLNGALLVEQSGEAVHERACDLSFDLGRVDGMAGISGGDDPVDFYVTISADRDLGACRHIAAVSHMLRQPAKHALWGRLAPTRSFSDSVQNGEMLRMVRHQLATELKRILAGRMGKLIHEAFEIESVLIVVHAAPEVRRDVRIAHSVVDQKVWNRITEGAFRAAGVEPLKHEWIFTVLQALRCDKGDN